IVELLQRLRVAARTVRRLRRGEAPVRVAARAGRRAVRGRVGRSGRSRRRSPSARDAPFRLPNREILVFVPVHERGLRGGGRRGRGWGGGGVARGGTRGRRRVLRESVARLSTAVVALTVRTGAEPAADPPRRRRGGRGRRGRSHRRAAAPVLLFLQ